MAEITATMVKDLREKTGAGMMDCKKALTEAAGDFEKAVALLRERGAALAAKRSSRAAREGAVAAWSSADRRTGALVELNCETDFVARNDDFKGLLARLAEHAGTFGGDPASIGDSAFDGSTVTEVVKASVGKIGENIVLSRAARITSDNGQVFTYIHPPGKIGVLVELVAEDGASASHEAFKACGEGLALHVAASAPLCLTRDEVSAETIANERAIYKQQAVNEGKPEAIAEKLVEGRLKKFFAEVVFSEQAYALDEKTSVEQFIAQHAKQAGGKFVVKSFVRFLLGEASAAGESEE